MGFRRFRTLSDIAKMGYWLRLTYGCGHTRRCDPDKLLERLLRRGADTRLSHLVDNLKCGKCGEKRFGAAHCEGPTIKSGYWPPGSEIALPETATITNRRGHAPRQRPAF